MVSATERNGKLIADFAAECPALRKAQMVSIRGASATNQAWLLRHISNVVTVTDPARLR